MVQLTRVGLRPGIGGGAGGGGAAGPSLSISATTVADNAAQGTLVGTVSVPAGYTLNLDDSCNGCFQLDGNDLEVGATSLVSGWYRACLSARISGSIPSSTSSTRITLYPMITVTPTIAPSDITGLTHAWRLDDSSVTVSGSDITTVTGAWGTSNTATGAFGSGGGTKPQFVSGLGPNGKNYAAFPSNRPRFTFTTTGGLTAATFFAVFFQTTASGQQATFGNSNSNNYISFSTSANAWSSQVAVKGNGGTEHTSNLAASGMFDQRGFQALVVVWDGANYIPYVNNIAGASSAHTDAITITQFGGLNTSLNFGGGVVAFGIYNKAIDATERGLLFRALAQFRTRDFFFSATGNDSNTGWVPSAPKLDPSAFSAIYKTTPGTRWMLNKGDRFNNTSAAITFPQDVSVNGFIGGCMAYDPATSKPPTDGSVATVAGSDKKTSGWTDNGDGTWTINPGFSVQGVWRLLSTGRYRVLINQATSSGNSWQYSAPNLTIRLQSGEDANTSTIEIGRFIAAVDTTSSTIAYYNLETIGTGGTGSLRNRGSAQSFQRCITRCASADSFNLAGTGVDTDCQILDIGPGTDPAAGDFGSTNYDAHTMHGGSHSSYGLVVRSAWWHCMAHQMQSNPINYTDLICDIAGIPGRLIANGANNGVINLDGFYMSRSSGSGVSGGITWDPTCGGTVNAQNGLMVGLGSQRGKAFDLNGSGGSGGTFNNLGNVSQTGFNSLT